ncbi:MAG TPA: imidazolonepropionase [Mycobacteriales bacterium]|nr:imidazolonepropionase [Mycobacteriales bacterium]
MSDLVVRRIGRLTTWATPRITDAAVVIAAGRVSWVGADADLPAGLGDVPELDAAGAAVMPGFVDCHTHLVWAGHRRDDLVGRLAGGDYSPAGIASTVAATRAASDAELMRSGGERIATMRRNGTTTVEIKSGYELTLRGELRTLDVIADLAASQQVRVQSTYLGAHVVPDGRDRGEYVDEVIASLPEARRHQAAWCDVFCDTGAFSVSEAERVLRAAADLGMGLRLHADQLGHTGGAQLAARLGCASADHLDFVTPADAAALAAAGVVGVLVPAASLYTGSNRWSHAAVLREAGVPLAIATDCNPGTAWCESMPYAVQLACLAMGLGVDEALEAATAGGARALRRADVGHLGVGACGDLVVLATDHEADVVARLGAPAVAQAVIGGVVQ